MSSSMASSLLRRTLRLPFSSSNFCRHCQPLFYSSRASSSSSPLVRRAVPQSLANPPSRLPLRFAFSNIGKSDGNLKRILESEIECAQQEDTHNQEEVALPDDFPFELIDNPGDQAIILKRELAGESIQVTVFDEIQGMDDENVDDDDDTENADKDDSSLIPSISLIVVVDKGDGPLLEFCCRLNSGELSIENMIMKKRDDSDSDDQFAYQGPEYSDLDENLQKAIHKYLEVRGVKGSLFDFLQEYLTKKDGREYITWLRNMKKFIES